MCKLKTLRSTKNGHTLIRPHLIRIALVTCDLCDCHFPLQPGGGTYDPRLMRIVDFGPNMYSVSLKPYEEPFQEIPSLAQVRKWLCQRDFILQQEDKYLGWWSSDKDCLFYLDISIVVEGYTDAIAIAQDNEQKGIYKFSTGETIYLPAA